jgi:spermidine synthase
MVDRLTFPIRSDRLSMSAVVSRWIHAERSGFQRIDIVETDCFGRVLLLDGHIQLAELDEHAYHEALVHFCGTSSSDMRRALVVGGGDGGALRELLKYATLESADIAEIDEAVIRACREHLPALSSGAFDDARTRLHVGDAFEFVKSAKKRYDLIVVDSTDVYEDEEGELSEALFTDAFYRDCLRILEPSGFVVTQADNPVFCPYSLQSVEERFRRVFPASGSYFALVPSFGGYSAFCWGSIDGTIARDFPGAEFELRYLSNSTWALGTGPLPFSTESL